jgi:hypothetical protein
MPETKKSFFGRGNEHHRQQKWENVSKKASCNIDENWGLLASVFEGLT